MGDGEWPVVEAPSYLKDSACNAQKASRQQGLREEKEKTQSQLMYLWISELIPFSFLFPPFFLTVCSGILSPWILLLPRARRSKRSSSSRTRAEAGGFSGFGGGRGGDTRPRYETLRRKRGIGWEHSTRQRKPPWPTTEPPGQCGVPALAPTSSTPTCRRAPPSPPSSPPTSPSRTSPPISSLPPPLTPTPLRLPPPPSYSLQRNAINSHSLHSPSKPTPGIGITPIFTTTSRYQTPWPPPSETTNSTAQPTSPRSLPRSPASSRVQVS